MQRSHHAGVRAKTGGVTWGGNRTAWHHTERPATHRWPLTYFGDEWRWDSEPYGKVVNVDWAWRELKDAGEELPEAVNSEDGDSGLQSQGLRAEQGQVPEGERRERTMDHTGQALWWLQNQEWTHGHRHSMAVVIHWCSNRLTNGQSGRGGGGYWIADMEGV